MDASTLVSIAGSATPWGQVLGLVGGLSTGVMKFFNDRDDRKFQLQYQAQQAQIDASKAASEMLKVREQGAADAYTASINADAQIGKSWTIVDAFRGSTRPGLTWYFTMLVTFLTLALLRGWVPKDMREDSLFMFGYISAWNLADMCITWWFGQRQVDKMTASFGNSLVNAKFGPTK